MPATKTSTLSDAAILSIARDLTIARAGLAAAVPGSKAAASFERQIAAIERGPVHGKSGKAIGY